MSNRVVLREDLGVFRSLKLSNKIGQLEKILYTDGTSDFFQKNFHSSNLHFEFLIIAKYTVKTNS